MSNVKTWVVGIGGTNADGICFERVTGTKEQVKKHLISLVEEDRSCSADWYYGTETVEDVNEGPEGNLYAYGCYRDFHIDYEAKLEDEIKLITL